MAAVVIAMTAILKRVASEWMGDEGAPNPTYIVTNLSYSFAAAILGGYVAATIGSGAPLAHACALAGIVFVLSIVSAVQMGNRQPRWYHIVLAFFATIGTVLGGLMRARG